MEKEKETRPSGEGGTNAAGEAILVAADWALYESMFGTGRAKCLKVQYAFHFACAALWAQPMRWLAACGRLPERGQEELVGDHHKPVAGKLRLAACGVRKGLLRVAEFCAKRVKFHYKIIATLKYVNLRRLMFSNLRLQIKYGVIDFDTLFRVRNDADELGKSLYSCYRSIERGYDVSKRHGVNYSILRDAIQQ